MLQSNKWGKVQRESVGHNAAKGYRILDRTSKTKAVVTLRNWKTSRLIAAWQWDSSKNGKTSKKITTQAPLFVLTCLRNLFFVTHRTASCSKEANMWNFWNWWLQHLKSQHSELHFLSQFSFNFLSNLCLWFHHLHFKWRAFFRSIYITLTFLHVLHQFPIGFCSLT